MQGAVNFVNLTNHFKKFGDDINTSGFTSIQYFKQPDWTPISLELAFQSAKSYYYYSSKLLGKLSTKHYKYLKRASTLYNISKYFPNENITKLYTHRMAELIIEGLDIAINKGIKFTLFSGDELNLLAWAVQLNLTNYECLHAKFMEYYSSAENPAVKSAQCLSAIEFGSNLLLEVFMEDQSV